MAKAGSWISSRSCINTIPRGQPTKPFFYFPTKASLKGNDLSLITKRSQRVSKRLVRISTSEGRWHGEWNSDYIFSLRDLQLEDLAEDAHRDTQVSINLSIHKLWVNRMLLQLIEGGPDYWSSRSPEISIPIESKAPESL
ncbi:hypothetical protein K7X08_037211 [Anisodus acutangulus]|uniref:Uncharacterized protein n=1 Tax=Anisodus acutangulus TaxID=402998 RepID=A0A9Q1LZ55_9SOLA|nr:hypothetical protein K7X08_037211 [Anisodus acutangulus]